MNQPLTTRAVALAAIVHLVGVAGAFGQSPPVLALPHTAAVTAGQELFGWSTSQPSPAQPPAAAANPPRRRQGKWALEVHGGRLGNLLSAGTSTGIDAFAVGAPFTTAGGDPSRAVASWMYGDGVLLFEQVRASFAANHGVAFPGITPLDGVMRGAGTNRKPGNAFGGRFSRDLTSWLALELAFDRGSSRTTFADGVMDGVEATRASYTAAFQALLATIPHTGGLVAATVTPASEGGSQSQTIATASIVLTPIRVGRLGVHVLFGGGFVKNDSSPMEVQLQGNYRFSVLSRFPINESETVAIRFSEKSQVPAAVVGAGFTLNLWGPIGLRADARVLATENTAVTTVTSSATRVTTAVAAQQLTFPSLTTPSIQFNNIPGGRTTLSGEPVNGLVTYSGRGYDLRPHVTVGLTVRF